MARLSKRKIAVLAFLSNHGKAGRQIIKREFAWRPGEVIALIKPLLKAGYIVEVRYCGGWYRSYNITNAGREAIGQQALPLEGNHVDTY